MEQCSRGARLSISMDRWAYQGMHYFISIRQRVTIRQPVRKAIFDSYGAKFGWRKEAGKEGGNRGGDCEELRPRI